MTKEKLAIISSYNDLCGNASYTKALIDGLSSHYTVSVIPLKVDLLREGKSKAATKHIQKVCSLVGQVDCVNIQFEAGLFGSTPSFIKKNFFAVVKASKRIMVTMHRYHGFKKYPGLVYFGKSLLQFRLKNFVKQFLYVHRNNRWAALYEEVLNFCFSRKIPVLVHTPRDRDLIRETFETELAFDHPLCFYKQEQIQDVASKYSRKDFCKEMLLDEDKIYVGIFGFINAYKGHETAIQAMQFLPEKYELLIFGSQHPHTIREEETIDKYIESLLLIVQEKELAHRVKFYRAERDEVFLKALLCCDFNVLPYLEVLQGGSAIASLALETNSQALFSQNKAFLELEKYASGSFKMFSIGNYLEMANAILTYRPEEFKAPRAAYHQKYNIDSSAALYKKLLSRDYEGLYEESHHS